MRNAQKYTVALWVLCLLFLGTPLGIRAQYTLTFEVTAPDLAPKEVVYLTGSRPQLGNWDPGKLPMEDQGDGVWALTVQLPSRIDIEYKFTLGTWDREAVDEKGFPLPNYRLKTGKTSKVSHHLAHWKNGEPAKVEGQVTGIVEFIRQVQGSGLKPRDLAVWLPPSYAQDPEARFPVLYLHDGQNLFDPQLAAFKVDWQVDETFTQLIEAGKVPPMIIVGIYNTADRRPEYGDTPLGAAYRKWLIEDLKPNIDKKYRTLPDAAHTSVGGSSMGGMVSFILAWEHPDVFSSALCMSPAFRIKRDTTKFDYVKPVKKYKGRKKPLRLYIDNGSLGVDKEIQPGVNKMLKALKKKGYTIDQDLFYVKDPDDPHSESAWAERLPVALEWLFGRK